MFLHLQLKKQVTAGSSFLRVCIKALSNQTTCTSSHHECTQLHDNIMPTSSSSSSMGFYCRALPSTLIPFSSPKGKQLFKEALVAGTMESFFPLSEQFVTQSEPSFCALSSLAMVLNTLKYDPKKIWKGIWRWVDEETLQCESSKVCGHSLENIRSKGMAFFDFEALARCHNVNIQSYPVDDNCLDGCHSHQYEHFRKLVIASSSSKDAHAFIVCNFSRKYLGQTGDGHFSPLGGYHSGENLVLVMDVARFKYPPYWVPLSELYEAMMCRDKAVNEPRGYFVIHSHEIDLSISAIDKIKHSASSCVLGCSGDLENSRHDCIK